MPYGLTAFQVITWLQPKSTNSYTLSPWLVFTCNTSKSLSDKSMSASSLPSYVLGGGMLPAPENDIPIQGEPQPSRNTLNQPWTMTKILAIDRWPTLIQSHKSHIYVIRLMSPSFLSFSLFSTDRHISTTHIPNRYV